MAISWGVCPFSPDLWLLLLNMFTGERRSHCEEVPFKSRVPKWGGGIYTVDIHAMEGRHQQQDRTDNLYLRSVTCIIIMNAWIFGWDIAFLPRLSCIPFVRLHSTARLPTFIYNNCSCIARVITSCFMTLTALLSMTVHDCRKITK